MNNKDSEVNEVKQNFLETVPAAYRQPILSRTFWIVWNVVEDNLSGLSTSYGVGVCLTLPTTGFFFLPVLRYTV